MVIAEEEKTVRVYVDEEELSKAIGRRGQNVRLTTRLVGWDVQVQKDESAHEAFEKKIVEAAKAISEAGVGMDQASELVRNGLTTVESVANEADEVDIADILDIEMDAAKELHAKVQAYLNEASAPA